MADPNDPKNEPVRITPLSQPAAKPPGPPDESREPVRINLPSRPPPRPARAASTASPTSPSGKATVPLFPAPGPISEGPKKETARVGESTSPESKATTPAHMKKTQPLVTLPEVTAPPSVPLTVTSEPPAVVESIPMPLCWAVFGVSALILIVQLWNYFS